jgi:hypothetical protein
VISYERHLPHWQPVDAALFITWRLYGSKPRSYVAPAGQAFLLEDRDLDAAATGPRWLGDPRIAQVVADAFRYGEDPLGFYKLIAWVIMVNHVHVLIDPRVAVEKITRSIKTFTARKANEILGLTRQPFWQDESYDRWIRSEDALNKVIQYIEGNPVAVGLCEKPEDWKWSSGWTGWEACPTKTNAEGVHGNER